jgi:hypothetical protein
MLFVHTIRGMLVAPFGAINSLPLLAALLMVAMPATLAADIANRVAFKRAVEQGWLFFRCRHLASPKSEMFPRDRARE